MPQEETKACQNCKQSFTVEPEDAQFYDGLNLPHPTFCFNCRFQRRMAFRNERTLYKKQCGVPGHSESILSVFSPESRQRVYDHASWWGDGWDPRDYGRDVDFSRPFLSQVRDLWPEVPDMGVLNINSVNSEYCNIIEGNKNCYLVFGGDFNEDVMYSNFIFHSKECMDTHWVSKSELSYEIMDCVECSRLFLSRYCEGCYNSAFLFNCRNCHDCFGCVNLVSKSYCIFNKQYSKEEYAEKMKEFDMKSRKGVEEIKKKFREESLKYPRRYARMIHTTNSIGDNLEETKNCRYAFEVFGGAEDCAYIWLAYSKVKNCYDTDHFGLDSELCCDSTIVYPGHKIFYSRCSIECRDVQYSYNCHNSSNLFGCIGMRSKQYCILNKQYSKEEYEALVPKIIEHMNATPYVDKRGRVYKYGEFFPAEISPFAYNETIAQEYFPLTKEVVEKQGWAWREAEGKTYNVTMPVPPETIAETNDSILNEVIQCAHAGPPSATGGGGCNEQCTTAFKVIPAELQFYRRMNLPLPDLCPNCRYYARAKQRNPLALWHRKCQCAGGASENGVYQNSAAHDHGGGPCPNEFETSYAPDKPEFLYCETCYQAEVQ